jgi:RNA polymerase sigma-70 factor (ECF subfamily)
MDTDDAGLLLRAAAGDRGAFEDFVRRWERPLGRFLLRVTGSPDRAEEVRQLTFVRVLTSGASFRGGGVSTWLFRTAFRIAIDVGRAETRRRTVPLDGSGPADDGRTGADGALSGAFADGAAGPADEAAAADEQAWLRRALARLEPEDRALLWLRVAEERPFREVSEALGLRESTARLRFVRALGRLRRLLRPGGSGGAVPEVDLRDARRSGAAPGGAPAGCW